MTISLHNLHPNPGSTKAKKRLGRGRGSGTGKSVMLKLLIGLLKPDAGSLRVLGIDVAHDDVLAGDPRTAGITAGELILLPGAGAIGEIQRMNAARAGTSRGCCATAQRRDDRDRVTPTSTPRSARSCGSGCGGCMTRST